MDRYLKELNKEQLKAVTTLSDKVLVIAGAGTGKTKVLTSRIKFLIDANWDESSIVAFTFTNKAASSMKFRLQHMLGKEPVCNLSTFHSYCFGYVFLFHQTLGFTQEPTIIDDDDKSKLIKDILNEIGEDYSNKEFVKNISKIKNHIDISKKLNEHEQLVLNKVYHMYQERLLSSNRLDYDDMIPLFMKLLELDPFLKEDILDAINIVLVDEFQDTNQIQMELVELLASRCGRIFAVGDEDQIIFSFRSSDISILKAFKDTADEVIVLNQNYRCSKQILTISNKLIDFNTDRTKKNLFSNINFNVDVKYRQVQTVYDEARDVAALIRKHQSEGIKLKEMAVIYRTNIQAYPIEKELMNERIPYQVFGGKPFFSYKEVKAMINYYLFCLNPDDWIAFDVIYNQPNPRMEGKDSKEFYTFYEELKKKENKTVLDAMLCYPKHGLQKLAMKIMAIRDVFYTLDNESLYMYMLEQFGFNRYIKGNQEQQKRYERLMALRDLIVQVNKTEIVKFINSIMLEEDKTNSSDTGQVSLLTIHKAKGLEFKVVFFIGCNEGIIPPLKPTKDSLEEERRICYVGFTRAIQYLYIFASEIHYINGDRKSFLPSSFLLESGLFGDVDLTFYKRHWYNR